MLSLEKYLSDLPRSSDKLGTIVNIKNVCFHGLSVDDLSLAAYTLFSRNSKVSDVSLATLCLLVLCFSRPSRLVFPYEFTVFFFLFFCVGLVDWMA
jgi:hypothetical protein